LFWLVAVVMVVLVGMGYHEPDQMKAAAMFYRLGVLGCLLSFLTLWPIIRDRKRTAPGVDHLAFLRMEIWNGFILICAVGPFVAPFVPAALRAAGP